VSDSTQPSLPESLRAPTLPVGLVKRFSILGALLLLVAATFIGWFAGAFDDQGYAPEQPIAYSHKLHAGEMHIPCLFCHFNADRGKHAGVPPMSVCLGCHGQGLGGVAANRPEIQKLQAIVDKGSYTDADGIIHDGGVVHWNRVHKLPDHVYFSHQWHVKAGVACQTCHGPVETMPVVRQYATLSMGWCLDCHRKSNYVGGPAYRHDDPASFSVGTANYAVVRARQGEDAEVEAVPRQLAGAPVPAAVEAGGPAALAAPATSAAPAGSTSEHAAALRASLRNLLGAHPELADRPRWRLIDLPETHRDAYRALLEIDAKGQPILDVEKTFMNAPTQCSTCHQ
jgi:Cytochrome c7 and related cytochrome c